MSLAPLIQVPYSNPYNISNTLNSIGFNPNNNYYGIIFVIGGTLAFFLLFRKLYLGRFAWLIKAVLIAALIANYGLVNSLLTPGYTDGAGIIDNFHAGEQLSAVNQFNAGQGLYTGTFYLRGAGVDVLLPALGLKMLGGSIGGFILTMDALEVLALLSFLILLAFLIRNAIAYAVTAVILYLSNALSLTQFRDIPVWFVVGLVLLAFRRNSMSRSRRWSLFALIGFLSSLELFMAVDRGVLLVILSLLTALIAVFFTADKNNQYDLSVSRWRSNISTSLSVIAGLFLGVLVPTLLLGWDGFIAFMRMTFIDIPAFGGLLVSQPFPVFASGTYMFWGPILLAITTGYLLLKLYGSSKDRDYNKLLPYSLLLAFGVLCLKAGANRIALSKLATVTTPLVLVCLLILIYAVTIAYHDKRTRPALILPILICSTVMLVFAQLDTTKIQYKTTYTRAQFAAYKGWPSRPNSSWTSTETNAVKDYILNNTNAHDYVYAFTSDPMYYYLADRRNPTRFNVSWFADPQPYTDELLKSLKANRPKLVVYKEGTWMDAPDNVSMEDRIPEVNEWLLANYPNQKNIGNTTILLP